MDDYQLEQLTWLFSTTMKKLNGVLPNVPYNFMLHTAPLRDFDLEYFHWHIEIMPKVNTVAGFEWGTGFYINTTPPEESAGILKDTEPVIKRKGE